MFWYSNADDLARRNVTRRHNVSVRDARLDANACQFVPRRAIAPLAKGDNGGVFYVANDIE